jgi:UDP-2,3-diacylglucosamine hydrolase
VSKLGILAGAGEFPAFLIDACRRRGWEFHVIALSGNADPAAIGDAPHDWMRLGEYGKVWDRLRAEGVDRVVFCGKVHRPPVSDLLIDWRTVLFLARIGGRLISDNRLLEAIVREFESKGFTVIGPADIEPTLLAREGSYGKLEPTPEERGAIAAGLQAARELGRRDAGQAVVMLGDAVIASEGADGTDALILRCAGRQKDGAGPILVKARKPQQQMRADPPVVGMVTLRKAAASGFRGIAVEPGGVLLLDGPALGKAADAAGMFLAGVDETPSGPR